MDNKQHHGRDAVHNAGSQARGHGGLFGKIFGRKGGRKQPEVPTDTPPVVSSTSASRPVVGPSRDASANSSLASVQAPNHESSHSDHSLWDCAYEALGKQFPDLVAKYQDLLGKEAQAMGSPSNSGSSVKGTPPDSITHDTSKQFNRAQLVAISISGLERMEEKTKYTIGGIEIVPREQMAQAAGLALWAQDWIGQAVKASPEASVAWAGVCIILPLLTNAKVADEASRDGFTYVTTRMRYYAALEPLVQQLRQSSNATDALKEADSDTILLYQHILEFQIRSILRFYHSHLRRYAGDAFRSQDWIKMKDEIEKLGAAVDGNLRQVNELVTGEVLDSLNRTSKESFESMQKLVFVSEQHLDIAQKQLLLQEDAVKRKLSKKEEECHQLFRLTTGDKDTTYEWYKNRVELRVEGTCQWFLNHDNFQSWLEQESGPLLVSADPGCGKSVLARHLIDQGLQSATICYFFFKDQDQNTVRQALCALLHQLFTQKPFLIKHAMSEYSDNGAGLINATASLWKILDNAVRDSQAGTVIIVLDALDECAEPELKDLAQHIKHQFYSKPSDFKLKFLLTSRPYGSIVSEFQDLFDAFPRVHIPAEDQSEAISQEVNLVIKHRADNLGLSANIREHLTMKLLEISHRTYLWVYLVFDHLKAANFKKTTKGVESAITTLPKNVNEAYEQILNKSQDRDEAKKALAIILAARRPLTLSEMNVVMNIQDKHTGFHDLDLEEDGDFKSRLRSWCGLFISIYGGKVYFLHQTAREFLLADLSSSITVHPELFWQRSITARHAHTVLAEQCVLYLDLFNSDESGHTIDSDAFLDYSAKNWGHHFREADVANNAPIITATLRICDPDSASYSVWIEVFWETERWRKPKNWTNICISSYFGHETVAKLLLATGKVDPDLKDKAYARTPLSWAAENGHEAIVKLLLATGKVDLDWKDTVGRTPLSWAALNGHESVVRLLLATGKVDPDSKDTLGRTPLLRASENGHEAIAKLLLAIGKADPDWKDEENRAPLSWAAEFGHTAVVNLLLATGRVDPDPKDTLGRTPLSWAALNGHEAVVKLLLATGKVDHDSKDEYNRTPLSRAAEKGREAVVKILLATGKVDPDWKDEYNRTPLSRAAEDGHTAVVKLLLATGRVDLESKNNNNITPLFWAATNGHEAIVKLLLATGKVDPDPKEKEFGVRPLSRVAEKGHEAVVKLLLATGKVDPDSKDTLGRTALSRAAKNGHEAIVKLLLATGKVDPDWKDTVGRTASSWAAEKGHKVIAKLLQT